MTSSDAQPTLTGCSVLLRPWASSDAEAVYQLCQDPEIQYRTTVPSPYRREDAMGYVAQVAPAGYAAGGGVFAICDLRSEDVLGAIGAEGISGGVAHVGYWMGAAARGRGYATDALRTVTAWLLHARSAVRVELAIEVDNTASLHVAESAGFTREGVLRQRMVLHDRRIDVALYSMLASDAAAPKPL